MISQRVATFRTSRRQGFTLVELVVVLIVIGILAIVVLPRFDLLRGFDEAGYRDKVKATLEFARKAAVAQRRNVCVAIAANGLDLTRDIRDPDSNSANCTQTMPLIASDTATGNGIRPRGTVALTGPATLTFDPLGRPSAAASYTVSGTTTYSIAVEAETGYVH